MQSGITLSFVSAGQSVELDSTLFRCPITSMEYRTVRGKTAHGSGRAGTFTWTAGVVGLSCTLVKAKLASLGLSLKDSPEGWNRPVVDDAWVDDADLDLDNDADVEAEEESLEDESY